MYMLSVAGYVQPYVANKKTFIIFKVCIGCSAFQSFYTFTTFFSIGMDYKVSSVYWNWKQLFCNASESLYKTIVFIKLQIGVSRYNFNY